MKSGNWTLLMDNSTLQYEDGNHWYEVDLERCNTSAQILDWIFQVNCKTWVTPKIMKDLLDLIETVLSPQSLFCSFGHDTPRKTNKEFIQARLKHNKFIKQLSKKCVLINYERMY